MESECEVGGANKVIMRLPRLFVLDRYRLRILARRAFKGSPVMVDLVGWLDARKKHRHPAQNARSRQITRLRRIIDMRLGHGARSYSQHRRERDWSLSHRRLEQSAVDDVDSGHPTNQTSQSANIPLSDNYSN